MSRPPARQIGRPLGEYAQALLKAAARGPAPMAELAARSQVGYEVARFKVPALARAGALVALTQERPRVYALPQAMGRDDALVMLSRHFWESGPADAAEQEATA